MWESVIMLRKLGVAAITVFMAREDLGVQMLVVMAVIMLALALQVGGIIKQYCTHIHTSVCIL
jgi:hypothetical protein